MIWKEHDMSTVQVRNNVLVALADWCTRFTGVVDAHVGALAACLADQHALVRKQALALLAALLSKVCMTFQKFLGWLLLTWCHAHDFALSTLCLCARTGSLPGRPTNACAQAGRGPAGRPAVQGAQLHLML